jgi:hypothetical protein
MIRLAGSIPQDGIFRREFARSTAAQHEGGKGSSKRKDKLRAVALGVFQRFFGKAM